MQLGSDIVIKKRKINHKTLYKLCYDATAKKKYNGKLAKSLTIGLVGSQAMQYLMEMSDTTATKIIKVTAGSVVLSQAIIFAVQTYVKVDNRYSLRHFMHDIKTRDLSYEELVANHDQYTNLDYWAYLDDLYSDFDTRVDHDNNVFTFILKLKNEAEIKEVITNDSYNCYYVENEKQEDITDMAKYFLGRRK